MNYQNGKQPEKRVQWGFVPIPHLTCSLSATGSDVNVALLPSTVHVPKMFWVVFLLSILVNNIYGLKKEGLNIRFDGLKAFDSTLLYFKGERKGKN